jgi:uncharacterized damage-inducible protein DinB
MAYGFLVDTYEQERLKTVTVWSLFEDRDLGVRPREGDGRGRTPREQMVHQCVSENLWFMNMLEIDVGAPPLPAEETRLGFMERYWEDSSKRLEALREKDASWWEGSTQFFEVTRSRAWVMTRRLTHSAHHRGQLTTLLRVLGRPLYSTYGPTADTGGLMQNQAPTVYPYRDGGELLAGERAGGRKGPLPEPATVAVTERPDPANDA